MLDVYVYTRRKPHLGGRSAAGQREERGLILSVDLLEGKHARCNRCFTPTGACFLVLNDSKAQDLIVTARHCLVSSAVQ